MTKPAECISIGDSLHWIGYCANYAYAASYAVWFNPCDSANYLDKNTRHNSGSDLGFVDGHAKWGAATAIKGNLPAWVNP